MRPWLVHFVSHSVLFNQNHKIIPTSQGGRIISGRILPSYVVRYNRSVFHSRFRPSDGNDDGDGGHHDGDKEWKEEKMKENVIVREG